MNLQKLPIEAAQKALDAVKVVLATDRIDPSLVFTAVQLYTPLTDYIQRQSIIQDIKDKALAAAAAADAAAKAAATP